MVNLHNGKFYTSMVSLIWFASEKCLLCQH